MQHRNNKPATFKPAMAAGLALALAALTSCGDAFACASCDSTLSHDWESQGIGSQQGFAADFSYNYLNQNQQRYGSSAASPSLIANTLYPRGQEIEAYTKTQTYTAALSYTSDTWGVSAQLPFVQRSHATWGTNANATPLYSSQLASNDTSLGDIKVIGRYTGFSADSSAGVIFGIKLATGNNNATFSDGTALDAGLQIGTGSTDWIMGGFATGSIGRFGVFAQGTLQHAMSTSPALGNTTYRPGDAYTFNSGIRYGEFGAKITPMLQLNIIKRQSDTGSGVPVDALNPAVNVSGGTLAYLAPGASVRLGGGTSVYGFVQLPVYRNVNSLQLVPKYTLTLGIRQSFM